MRAVKDFSGDALWGVIPYLQPEFDRLSDQNSNTVFFNGIKFLTDANLRNRYKEYPRRVLFAHWTPCEFTHRRGHEHYKGFDFFTDVYCVCPYTTSYMNKIYGTEKFKYVAYPFTNYSVHDFYQHDGTVCSWVGSIHGQDHISAIETIEKFPYKFITSQQNTWMRHPYEFKKCTHVNISTSDKLKEISKTKSSLTFNKLYRNKNWVYFADYKGFHNEAFDYWDDFIMPQFKVRTHEIASCKSLILAYKDQWNLIEDFYIPNEEFIYFESFSELEEILNDIQNNFSKYKPIIERAYARSQNYTVEKIFEYMKTNDKSLITWNLRGKKY